MPDEHSPTHMEITSKPHKDLLIDCYNLAADYSSKFDVHSKELLKIDAYCLFIKILNITKAIHLLTEENLLAEVHVLLRHQLEAVFILRALHKDPEFLKAYVDSDTLQRLKLCNIEMSNIEFFKPDKEATKARQAELKQIIDSEGIKEIKVKELTKIAGLADYYDSPYRYLSGIVHVSSRSLEDYFVCDDKGELQGFLTCPYENKAPKLLITAIDFILLALECMNGIFSAGLEDNILQLRQRHCRLWMGNCK